MRLFCRHCNEETAHFERKDEVNHVLHLLLSIITGGLWLFVWIILVATAKKNYVCSRCDQER